VFSIKLSGRNKLLVAGSKVRHGLVERGSKVRVLRGDEEVIYTGEYSLLFKAVFCGMRLMTI
jgi:translation initiation factor IF-2